jgi:hypothetical protein
MGFRNRVANRASAGGGHASPDAVMTMPAAVVHTYPHMPDYLMANYQMATPVPSGTPSGLPSAAVREGRHATLKKAGRP